jgi:lysophospholipase L1-like esterase
MRESYLWAAGLLTGLAMPAPALPQMSIILPEISQLLRKFPHNSQFTVDENHISHLDIAFAELTKPELPEPLPELPEPLVNFNSLPSPVRLVSGNQLYHHRFAALKTGRIYTRMQGDTVQILRDSAQKRHLTYEDWKNLLALEAKAISKGQGNNALGILLGDSLSLWFPREKLPHSKLWLNQGISGDTSAGIYRRLRAFSSTRPDVIYIMAGINDLRRGESNEEILQNHRRIIRKLRQNHPNTEIIVQSILPTRLESIPNSRIIEINKQLALIAEAENAQYLHIYDWFTDFQGNLRSELTTDGLHLSEDGYDVWRSALQHIQWSLPRN